MLPVQKYNFESFGFWNLTRSKIFGTPQKFIYMAAEKNKKTTAAMFGKGERRAHEE